jgi:predicted  nucleic acid-binding Zn-ribbon protein
MPDPQIEKLLIVQARDIELQKIEQELSRIPKERAAVESQIKAEEGNIEAAAEALKAKEVERHELDSEVKSKEATINRFRTQQLEVKKNDEYRALTQQIEQNEQAIAELEEREIALMIEIDAVRATYETEKNTIELRIKQERERIEQLNEREVNLSKSIESARSELNSARSAADPGFLEHYDRVRKLTKRPPYVAPIEAHKCGGCHLRVSNEVSGSAGVHGEPHFCDQCARIVYA